MSIIRQLILCGQSRVSSTSLGASIFLAHGGRQSTNTIDRQSSRRGAHGWRQGTKPSAGKAAAEELREDGATKAPDLIGPTVTCTGSGS